MNVVEVTPLTEQYIPQLADYWDQLSDDDLLKMGALRSNIPKRNVFIKRLTHQLSIPDHEKEIFAMIALKDNVPIGHCNLNPLRFGDKGKMHLHLWNSNTRSKGIGKQMVEQSIPVFFERFELKKITCEPLAENSAPHRVLQKVGFTFIKQYTTLPSPHCFEQEVKKWEIEAKDI